MHFTHQSPAWDSKWDVEIDVQLIDGPFAGSLERLAVRRVTDDQFEVCCIPFGLYGVCLGDIVRVDGLSKESPGTVSETVRDAGRHLYRVARAEGGETLDVNNIQSMARSFGCLTETWGSGLVAVDVADQDSALVLEQVLDKNAAWVYETGRQQGA